MHLFLLDMKKFVPFFFCLLTFKSIHFFKLLFKLLFLVVNHFFPLTQLQMQLQRLNLVLKKFKALFPLFSITFLDQNVKMTIVGVLNVKKL